MPRKDTPFLSQSHHPVKLQEKFNLNTTTPLCHTQLAILHSLFVGAVVIVASTCEATPGYSIFRSQEDFIYVPDEIRGTSVRKCEGREPLPINL